MPAHMAATMEGLNKIKEESIDLVRFGPSSLLFVYPVLVFFTNQSVDLVYAQLSFFFWFDRPSNIPVEEVFVRLKCSSEGLTSSEADARTAMFGPNKLEEKKGLVSLFPALEKINS